MTWILHIIAALLWALFAIMAMTVGALAKSEPEQLNGLAVAIAILVGVIAFTIQVIA